MLRRSPRKCKKIVLGEDETPKETKRKLTVNLDKKQNKKLKTIANMKLETSSREQDIDGKDIQECIENIILEDENDLESKNSLEDKNNTKEKDFTKNKNILKDNDFPKDKDIQKNKNINFLENTDVLDVDPLFITEDKDIQGHKDDNDILRTIEYDLKIIEDIPEITEEIIKNNSDIIEDNPVIIRCDSDTTEDNPVIIEVASPVYCIDDDTTPTHIDNNSGNLTIVNKSNPIAENDCIQIDEFCNNNTQPEVKIVDDILEIDLDKEGSNKSLNSHVQELTETMTFYEDRDISYIENTEKTSIESSALQQGSIDSNSASELIENVNSANVEGSIILDDTPNPSTNDTMQSCNPDNKLKTDEDQVTTDEYNEDDATTDEYDYDVSQEVHYDFEEVKSLTMAASEGNTSSTPIFILPQQQLNTEENSFNDSSETVIIEEGMNISTDANNSSEDIKLEPIELLSDAKLLDDAEEVEGIFPVDGLDGVQFPSKVEIFLFTFIDFIFAY